MDSDNGIKIAIFGGSQGLGLQCLFQALEQGFQVSVLTRDSSKLNHMLQHGLNFKIIQGDINDIEKVRETIEGNNVVIVSLGGWDDVCSKGTEKIIHVMNEKNVKRIITCTSLGCGDSYDDCSFFTKAFIWGFIRKPIEDKNLQEKFIFNSGLDWTVVRPARLMNEPSKNIYITEGVSGGSIPRIDVARFMLNQISSTKYLHKAVSLASE